MLALIKIKNNSLIKITSYCFFLVFKTIYVYNILNLRRNHKCIKKLNKEKVSIFEITRLINSNSNLTEKELSELTSAIIETKDEEYIFYFARDVEGLTKENKDDLTRAILKTKNALYIYHFASCVEGLTKENFDDLFNAILKTRDLIYIAKMLYISKDVKLIESIFDSLDKYVSYCSLNNEKLGLDMTKFEEVVKNLEFNYVDENIDEYLKKHDKSLEKKPK